VTWLGERCGLVLVNKASFRCSFRNKQETGGEETIEAKAFKSI